MCIFLTFSSHISALELSVCCISIDCSTAKLAKHRRCKNKSRRPISESVSESVFCPSNGCQGEFFVIWKFHQLFLQMLSPVKWLNSIRQSPEICSWFGESMASFDCLWWNCSLYSVNVVAAYCSILCWVCHMDYCYSLEYLCLGNHSILLHQRYMLFLFSWILFSCEAFNYSLVYIYLLPSSLTWGNMLREKVGQKGSEQLVTNCEYLI